MRFSKKYLYGSNIQNNLLQLSSFKLKNDYSSSFTVWQRYKVNTLPLLMTPQIRISSPGLCPEFWLSHGKCCSPNPAMADLCFFLPVRCEPREKWNSCPVRQIWYLSYSRATVSTVNYLQISIYHPKNLCLVKQQT